MNHDELGRQDGGRAGREGIYVLNYMLAYPPGQPVEGDPNETSKETTPPQDSALQNLRFLYCL